MKKKQQKDQSLCMQFKYPVFRLDLFFLRFWLKFFFLSVATRYGLLKNWFFRHAKLKEKEKKNWKNQITKKMKTEKNITLLVEHIVEKQWNTTLILNSTQKINDDFFFVSLSAFAFRRLFHRFCLKVLLSFRWYFFFDFVAFFFSLCFYLFIVVAVIGILNVLFWNSLCHKTQPRAHFDCILGYLWYFTWSIVKALKNIWFQFHFVVVVLFGPNAKRFFYWVNQTTTNTDKNEREVRISEIIMKDRILWFMISANWFNLRYNFPLLTLRYAD